MSIKIEDIPDNMQGVAEIIGLENFIKLCKNYGGALIYIPIYRKIQMAERNRKILEEYNGLNTEKLARKYNLTIKQIKNVVRK